MWKAFAELEAIGLDRARAAAHGRGPGRRLRADRQGVRGRRRACRALGGCPHRRGRHPRAQGGRRFPDPARGARERRLRDRRRATRRSWPRVDDGRASATACCSAPKAARRWRRAAKARERGPGRRDDRVVLFNCATGLKYPMRGPVASGSTATRRSTPSRSRPSRRLQPVGEALAQLLQLGRDDGEAIGIALAFALPNNPGDNPRPDTIAPSGSIVVTIGAGQSAAARSIAAPRRRLLLAARREDRRAILGADVIALAVELGRIVGGEEDVEQLVIGDRVGIEGDPDRLGMAGVAAADLPVGRVGDMAADIAALDLRDADHVLEHRLGAPEAPARQESPAAPPSRFSFPPEIGAGP